MHDYVRHGAKTTFAAFGSVAIGMAWSSAKLAIAFKIFSASCAG
jgi:hypothetical protein